ncbi:hypothetical protein P154DRAFT_190091 [Amniculicola lignicola CBS 123094]|uniref:Uncharacterized protein n=1 Tax=Amniculicola lignicola CBS 123094 TaxID=1392246 RepID=A0A6A5WL96_9PLEO|nr:hypothetical protein P154DRAFT_190091 [Amniculicola lignicola CBS 123094]
MHTHTHRFCLDFEARRRTINPLGIYQYVVPGSLASVCCFARIYPGVAMWLEAQADDGNRNERQWKSRARRFRWGALTPACARLPQTSLAQIHRLPSFEKDPPKTENKPTTGNSAEYSPRNF